MPNKMMPTANAQRALDDGVEILCRTIQQVEATRDALAEARVAMRQLEEMHENAVVELQAQAKRVVLLAAQTGIVSADRIPLGIQGLAVTEMLLVRHDRNLV